MSINHHLLAGATLSLASFMAAPAFAQAPSRGECLRQVNDTVAELTGCVTVRGVRRHQRIFQAAANINGGVRASGTRGYNLSVAYVSAMMRSAGYRVTRQPFEFVAYEALGPSTLAQEAPTATTYVEGEDYALLSQTDPGNVSGPVAAVDLDLGLDNSSSSGCEPEDFDGFPSGSIALVQRGACAFGDKAENAAAAGAIGAIVFN